MWLLRDDGMVLIFTPPVSCKKHRTKSGRRKEHVFYYIINETELRKMFPQAKNLDESVYLIFNWLSENDKWLDAEHGSMLKLVESFVGDREVIASGTALDPDLRKALFGE